VALRTYDDPSVPVDYRAVRITGGFWGRWQDVVRTRSLPHIYDWLEQSGRLEAFDLTWKQGEPEPHIFWDSDVYKWLEAASYALTLHHDPGLRTRVDDAVERIRAAQQPDGYLNIYFTAVRPQDRFTDLEGGHELYCAGHLFEAAVAHYGATGSTTLLEVARRYADYLIQVFGTRPGQIPGYPGHEEIELALVKLYRVTGEQRYLHLARYFLDQRGQEPHYFSDERQRRGHAGFLTVPFPDEQARKEYNQSHVTVREQTAAVGHAVRAMYLYTAMTDLCVETGDKELRTALDRLWESVTARRAYVTGGLGSSATNEGFTTDYDLPLDTAYAETCAAIGAAMWQHRLLQLGPDRRYADYLERLLYNAILASVSLDGTRFFYANPMLSDGQHERSEWFTVACCPPNLARFVLSLGGYVYSQSQRAIAVHLYVQSQATIQLESQTVRLTQHTDMPSGSDVVLTVDSDTPQEFALWLRLPAWSDGAEIQVNGEPIHPAVIRGYAVVERKWVPGDRVAVSLARQPRWLFAHPRVAATRDRAALAVGPLIYCFEGADNLVDLELVRVRMDEAPTIIPDPHFAGERVAVQAEHTETAELLPLYQDRAYPTTGITLTAVPYWAWGNRRPGAMRIWMRHRAP
jgi:DUF1680 family protein